MIKKVFSQKYTYCQLVQKLTEKRKSEKNVFPVVSTNPKNQEKTVSEGKNRFNIIKINKKNKILPEKTAFPKL